MYYNLICQLYPNKAGKIRRVKTFGHDEYVCGIDCDDAFTDAYLFPNSSSYVHELCSFLCVDHTLLKWIFKKETQEKTTMG